MIAKDGGKRKQLAQPTLVEIFKRQRVENKKETKSSSMGDVSQKRVIAEQHDVAGHSSTTQVTTDDDEDGTLEYFMCDSEDSSSAMFDNEPEEPVRLGAPFDSLYRTPNCSGPVTALHPHPGHTILFRAHPTSLSAEKPPRPYPDTYRDNWDRHHVRMPCSKESLYPVKEKKLVSRWEMIRSSLLRPMTSSYDLQEAILSYNAHYAKRWNFRTLHLYFLEKITTDEHSEFFNITLPAVIKLALQLPTVCTQSVPLLKRQQEHTITISQLQTASLLANAFLCTFPRRNGVLRSSEHEFGNYPDINFSSCNFPVCRLRVCSDGTIEDNAPGFLQVDFANKFVGGGVLGEGCVQEEIRFAICPELILSRLFTERLEENECLLILVSRQTFLNRKTTELFEFLPGLAYTGVFGWPDFQAFLNSRIVPACLDQAIQTRKPSSAERYSNYSGYAETFRFTGNHDDKTPRDRWGRLLTEVVAIDAKPHVKYLEQFSPPNLKRELEKAFCGFLSRETKLENLSAVATGKWGCGAFNGNPQLKSLIQIMAASAARRDLLYFTFDDTVHAKKLHEIHCLLRDRNVTIGNLWQILNNYRKQLSAQSSNSCDLFSYIRKVVESKDDSSDLECTTECAGSSDRTSPSILDDLSS